ncbi:hypothetical protein [Haloplanus halobius]|uniref:hypothetical protein n=1 Tax=Haloplanus halobius TaxID=2934938 RepID=UPI00200EABD7|nr:hypothetical protein [Haloplanus sp. XH21]
MDVLIDTNVFIEREGDWTVPEPLQELEKLLKTEGHTILIHPHSKQEIRNYENDERRETDESKIETYAELGFPPYPNPSSTAFRNHVPEADSFNEQVDNALLYTVFKDRTDILITEDGDMHRKADELGIKESVLSIEEAREQFREEPAAYEGPPSVQKQQVADLDVDDPIFDSLKEDYAFRNWFESIRVDASGVGDCFPKMIVVGVRQLVLDDDAPAVPNDPCRRSFRVRSPPNRVREHLPVRMHPRS